MSTSLFWEAAYGLAGYAIGTGSGFTRGVRRERRKVPPPPDPTLFTVCPSCGEPWGKWTAVKWDKEAERFEQNRTCDGCGRAQRREVPRKEKG